MWKTAEKNCWKTAETCLLENDRNILGCWKTAETQLLENGRNFCWKTAEISAVFQQCPHRIVDGLFSAVFKQLVVVVEQVK